MPENEPCKHEGEYVLLVEGKDDCHVVMHLCEAHKVHESFGIYACGSDDKQLKKMNALILRPDRPKALGVVIDADKNSPQIRWDAIRAKLKRYPYKFPHSSRLMKARLLFILISPGNMNRDRHSAWLSSAMPCSQTQRLPSSLLRG